MLVRTKLKGCSLGEFRAMELKLRRASLELT
jgi:hypothetical protein